MKILKTIAVCVLLNVCYYEGSAQKIPINEPDYNKPKLFNDLPQKTDVLLEEVDANLDQPVGKHIAFQIARGVVIQGVVVSKSDPADASVKSVVIKSSNRQGAACTLTKIFNADGTVSYKGRIISMRHGDAFEIVSEKGNYILQKTNLYDLYNE